MTASRLHGRIAPLLLGATLMTGALVSAAAPAMASTASDDGTLCVDYDTLEAAQAAVDAGDVDTANLDPDGDGQACEEDELPRAGVVCPPVEVSDLYGLLPGECDVAEADPDLREGMSVPVGGVDTGAGGAAGSDGTLLVAGAGLAALGGGGLVLARRRRVA